MDNYITFKLYKIDTQPSLRRKQYIYNEFLYFKKNDLNVVRVVELYRCLIDPVL